jgi:hypothetical protein
MKMISRLALAALLVLLAVLPPAAAGTTRTQVIQLEPGWNAVFLEVQPPDTDPAAVFSGLPVDIVARYFPTVSSVQYITDPSEDSLAKPGWGVWYAPGREDAFLSTLTAVTGQRGYLVHATSAASWQVTGPAVYDTVRWRVKSFNLVGFGLDGGAPPTFGRFFSASGGLVGSRIYRLVNGSWKQVTSPGTTLMRAGEAYWVYCTGDADYQGPVELTLPGGNAVNFGPLATERTLTLRNVLDEPVAVTIQVVPGADGGLPLRREVKALATLQTSYPALPEVLALPTLGAGETTSLCLQVRREAMNAAEQSMLLRITTDAGTETWLPVLAERPDLAVNP